jgi:hypothetical protein
VKDGEEPATKKTRRVRKLKSDKIDEVKIVNEAAVNKIRADATGSRILSAADFAKIRKLQAKAKEEARNPRALAKRKRDDAQGKEDDESEEEDDDDDDSSSEDRDDFDDDDVMDDLGKKSIITNADLQSEAKRKRLSKSERLESILTGRSTREEKKREGGSTNTEKTRKKNFLMQKHSFLKVRKLQNEKQTRFNGAGKKRQKDQNGKAMYKKNAAKRRRK